MNNCSRCAGLMVWDEFPQMWDDPRLRLWRCVNCGFATDPVMEANRVRPPRVGIVAGSMGSHHAHNRRVAAQALSVS